MIKTYCTGISSFILLFVSFLWITGCEQDSIPFFGPEADSEFDKTTSHHFFCYSYASSLSLNPDARKHFEIVSRMQAGKFCKPGLVDYYSCIATRKIMNTNEACIEPSPPPVEAEFIQCANDVANHLAHIKNSVDKRTKAATRLSKQHYQEVCSLGNQNASGLSTFH